MEIAVSDLYGEAAMTRHYRKVAGYLHNTELKTRLRTDTDPTANRN